MKQNIFNASFFIILLAANCAVAQPESIPDSLKYLGQTPPDTIPVRFPPDYLLADSDWFWHGPLSFSPDLEEMYWGKHIVQNHKGKIFYMKFINGQWSAPAETNFMVTNDSYNNPVLATSNDTLWFQSSETGAFIYRVTRISGYWSTRVPLQLPVPPGKNPGLQFSMTNARDIYSELDEADDMDINIYKWKKINGTYISPEKLDSTINSSYFDFCPFIDPDEHYLIFASTRPGGFGGFDLYISNRNPEGNWSAPVNLGSTINTEADEWAPYISPDGLYFFFLSQRTGDMGYNPYWVNAEVIYQLVTGIRDPDEQGKILPFDLFQNSPNPFSGTTSIKYSLLRKGFVTLKIYNSIGTPIATLVNKEVPAGDHEISFDAADLPGGIYACLLRVDDAILTRKLVIAK